MTLFDVYKVSSTRDELRDLIIGSLILQDKDAIAVTVRAGAERIRNADFLGGRRHDYVAQLALRLSL